MADSSYHRLSPPGLAKIGGRLAVDLNQDARGEFIGSWHQILDREIGQGGLSPLESQGLVLRLSTRFATQVELFFERFFHAADDCLRQGIVGGASETEIAGWRSVTRRGIPLEMWRNAAELWFDGLRRVAAQTNGPLDTDVQEAYRRSTNHERRMTETLKNIAAHHRIPQDVVKALLDQDLFKTDLLPPEATPSGDVRIASLDLTLVTDESPRMTSQSGKGSLAESVRPTEMRHLEDDSAPKPQIPQKVGRPPNEERRAAIHDALTRYGRSWRDHLGEVFAELDQKNIDLGDLARKKIDLGDGQHQTVEKWEDLDLAVGDQRNQLVDALRKYVAALNP